LKERFDPLHTLHDYIFSRIQVAPVASKAGAACAGG